MRQQAVKAIAEGQSATSVAAAFGVNSRSVFRWLAAFASGGQKALLAKPVPGRPQKVTAEEMRWLAQTIRDKTPRQFQFEYALWTLGLVGEVLYRKFSKRLARGSVSRLLRILGFTVQKPLDRAWQQDPVLVQKWQAETYPAIRAEARAAGATIYFGDEAGMRSDHHAGTTWAPEGETPVVKVSGRRFCLNKISAVKAQGELRFMRHEGTVGAAVFREFLKRLMVGAKRPIFLVVDGHSIHKAKLIQDFVAKQEGRLKLFYLPPYSPQPNPDEQVWGNVKARVAKRTPQNKIELRTMLTSALRRLQKLPQLVRGFFHHPECRCAAL